jgi:hypothetical protein
LDDRPISLKDVPDIANDEFRKKIVEENRIDAAKAEAEEYIDKTYEEPLTTTTTPTKKNKNKENNQRNCFTCIENEE